ncbi:uncharacterized protein [Parasteatoda tepidariorum]|uniref:uncharacterized protein n=1 Tax=Parasteatoda tepidariorum TaxID=114398 RepID=UPI0039BD35C9
MIGKLEEGRSVTNVTEEFGINKSVVSRAWNAFKTTGTAVRKVGGGRPKKTTPRDDRYIVLQAEKNLVSERHISAIVHSHRTTNESRFSATSDSQRQLIWREVGARFHPKNIAERDCYGDPGVVVWSGIMLNRLTELQIFDRGSATGDRYCNEVILPHVRLFRGAIGPDFIFMDDNARPHRTANFQELLESEDITRMD